ncbi:hypothetical protein [Streptomyces sp. NPDC059080]|uniref:hypothetical protein n=1 Tax=Streptomyces sp. NPDC059080 TaxID=3346718 RepID=UPI0036AB90EB
MKVRFTGNAHHGTEVTQGTRSLKTGAEYVVLEFHARADGRNNLRIESLPNRLPALFDARLFEVTDHHIPHVWQVFIDTHGRVSMRPPSWAPLGFWESLMDGESWAIDRYMEEKSRIESC